MENIKNLVEGIISGEADESQFKEIMAEKVLFAIEQKKKEMLENFFELGSEEDSEEVQGE